MLLCAASEYCSEVQFIPAVLFRNLTVIKFLWSAAHLPEIAEVPLSFTQAAYWEHKAFLFFITKSLELNFHWTHAIVGQKIA